MTATHLSFTPEKPLISIIIATMNAGNVLEDCLHSISAQTCPSIEVVIVDGGSSDRTMSIIKSFHHLLLRTVSEPDQGIYDAMNKGITMASGRWIYFLGADDRLLPGFSEMVNHLKDESTIYYGNSKSYYHKNGKPPYELLTGAFSPYRLSKYCINHQSVIYPAGVFKKYQYDKRYKVFADYALNIRVWTDKSFKRRYLPIFIALYSLAGFSTFTKDPVFSREKPFLIRKHMGWLIYLRFMIKRLKSRFQGRTDMSG